MRLSAGIDVAKDVHWICVIDDAAQVLLSASVDNTQEGADGLIGKPRALDGELTIGVDLVGTFASLLQATLLADGFALVYVPGIAVNRARDGFAGRKSDPKDTRIIADQVRTRRDLKSNPR